MDGCGIPKSVEDAMKQYPHITREEAESFLDIEATPEQWKAADIKAKADIDTQLENYKYFQKAEITEGLKVMVIGATGVGKSATANTLIGHKWFGEEFSTESGASVKSEPCAKIFPIDNSILKGNLVVCDTPGSWQSQIRSPGLDGVGCYIIVINLATPRFSQETLIKITSLKGLDGVPIIKSGRFMVALSHADSALDGISLNQYLNQIHGDPLHTFLTQVARGRVVAINNAAETEYQREKQQLALFTILVQMYNQGLVYYQPNKERSSSFKEGFTSAMSSAKRIGGQAFGDVLTKARVRFGSASETPAETLQPSTQDAGTSVRYTRSWSTPDGSVTTSQPHAQDEEIGSKDGNHAAAPVQQQQQQQQYRLQGQQQEVHVLAEIHDQEPVRTTLGTGGGDNLEPVVEKTVSDRKGEQEEVDLVN